MVHIWMLPLPRRQFDNRECHNRAQGATPGLRNARGGILNVKLFYPEGGANLGGANCRRVGGYVVPLPPAPVLMVLGREDVEHGTGGEGGEVPDGLHPGYGLPSLLECVCMGTQA